MPPRFLADAIDLESSIARLSSDEARHLSQVLRLGTGDEVAVFDGVGREFLARVEAVERNGATLAIIEPIASAPEPAVRLTLAQAFLKGEKMDDVVRDATMMGVSAIEPLVTDHTVRHPRTHDRWKKITIASAKQCGRAVVPTVGAGFPFADWLPADRSALRLMLVEPSASVTGHPVSTIAAERPSSATLLVGPEGGWSREEIEQAAAAGYVPISLGHRTLRADAVPIIAIGVLQFVWGDL